MRFVQIVLSLTLVSNALAFSVNPPSQNAKIQTRISMAPLPPLILPDGMGEKKTLEELFDSKMRPIRKTDRGGRIKKAKDGRHIKRKVKVDLAKNLKVKNKASLLPMPYVRKSIHNLTVENFSKTLTEIEPFLQQNAGQSFYTKSIRRISRNAKFLGVTVPEGYAKNSNALKKKFIKQGLFIEKKEAERVETEAAAAAEAEAAKAAAAEAEAAAAAEAEAAKAAAAEAEAAAAAAPAEEEAPAEEASAEA